MTKFVLIGLPGVGKSTTLKKCAELFRSRGLSCEIRSTDDIIRSRFTPNDPVILKFEEMSGKKIPAEVFSSEKPTGAFMKVFGEEPLFRDLEEMYVKDIISSSTENDWFDLGGKAPLREGSVSVLHDRYIIPIFLYAQHETIIERLSNNDQWKNRSNYLAAGVDGWKKLAESHRGDRLVKYINASPIIVSVDQEDTEKAIVRNKSTDELCHEILYRLKELSLACQTKRNKFTSGMFPYFNERAHPDRNNEDISCQVGIEEALTHYKYI